MTLKAWLIALALARGLDAASTCAALHSGAVDVNPLIHSCAGAIAVTSTMTAIQAVTLPGLAQDGHPKAAKWIARVSTWAEVAISAHNVRVAVVLRAH